MLLLCFAKGRFMVCSIRELARRIGVTDTTINNMRADGRLMPELFGRTEGGRPYVIDPERTAEIVRAALTPSGGAGRAAGLANRDNPIKSRGKAKAAAFVEAPAERPISGEPSEPVQPTRQPMSGVTDDLGLSAAPDYQEQRALREQAQARLAELELKQKSGALVSKEDIRAVIFSAGRKLRDSLLQVPNRLAPRLASETDQHVITLMLTEEFNKALKELAHDFERAAGD